MGRRARGSGHQEEALGLVRAQVCLGYGFDSSPGTEVPSDSAARGHGGLAHLIPLNGAGASGAKGMRGQDSWWSSHEF